MEGEGKEEEEVLCKLNTEIHSYLLQFPFASSSWVPSSWLIYDVSKKIAAAAETTSTVRM